MKDLKEFYKKIFSLDYLIKYGYYDIDVKHIDDQNDEDQNNDNQDELELENEIKKESNVYIETDNFYSRYFNMNDVVEFLENKNLDYYLNDNDKVIYNQDGILKQGIWTDPIIDYRH